MGCANYTVTFNCVTAESLNIVYVVLNSPIYSSVNPVNAEGLAATIRQRWSNDDFVSPEFTREIIMSSDGNPFFRKESGVESEGSIPAEGADVTFGIVNDSFIFNPQKHSFKYLISNTEYTSSDINTLLPLLNTATPIESPVTGLNQVSFNYTNASNHDYLYLVWDLRYSQQVTLNYDASSASTACCTASGATYYIDSPSFLSATMIYDDAALLTKSADGFYNEGTDDGGFYRELDTVSSVKILQPRTKCDGCGSGPVPYDTFVGNSVQYNTANDGLNSACQNKAETLQLYRASFPINAPKAGDVFYTTSALTGGTEYNGNNKYVPLRLANSASAEWYATKINGSGVVVEAVRCVDEISIGTVSYENSRGVLKTLGLSEDISSNSVELNIIVGGAPVVFKAIASNNGFNNNQITSTISIGSLGTATVTTSSRTGAESSGSITVPVGTHVLTLSGSLSLTPPNTTGGGAASFSHNGLE